MIQSKAIEILSRFNRKEFLEFGKYLKSEFFISNKKLFKLYNFLKIYYPLFDSPKLSKETLFASVYGNSGYNYSRTRKLLSDLYKEAEKYLIIKNALAEKDVSARLILKQFDRRKLDNMFISEYNDYNMYLDAGKKNSDYFLEKFITEWRYIIFCMERGLQYKITSNIYRRVEYLVMFFLSDLTLTLNDMEAHKISFNTEYKINLAQKFIDLLDHKKLFEYIEANNLPNSEIVFIYYYGYLALKNFENPEYYEKLRNFVLENLDKFNDYAQRAGLLPLINYCVRKININNDLNYRKELYSYYNIYLNRKLYNISGKNYIRNDILLNIFSNFFSLGKTKEIKKFIEEHIENIQPAHRKNMTVYANALSNFEEGNFSESLRNTSMIKTNTHLYKDYMKILILKNHYELKNYESAIILSKSYLEWLNERNDISEIRKAGRSKFIYYYNLLWKFFENKKVRISLNRINEEIESEGIFIEKTWLINKFNELSKSRKNRLN